LGGADKDWVGGPWGGGDAARAGRNYGRGGHFVRNDTGCDFDVSGGAKLTLPDNSVDKNIFGGGKQR
jgi:hypothetical protein